METIKRKKVFISWSKPISNAIAVCLRDWLNEALPRVEVWISSTDIALGRIWLFELLKSLKESSVGIICLTSENLTSPFIHFETGALLAQEVDQSQICVFRYDVEENNVPAPLNIFQYNKFDKYGTLNLLKTINDHLSEEQRIPNPHLESYFEATWLNFEESVRKAVANAGRPPVSVDYNPVKWIQVAGSGNINNPLSPDVLDVCQILGKKLAQHNFGLVTANWPLVDEEVTRAYCLERDTLGRKRFDKHVVRADVPPAFSEGDPIYVSSPHSVWGRQALEIDACILVAGEGGALQSALWMSIAGKPVFPIAQTKGDAEKYFYACKEEPFKLNERIFGITKNDFEKLNDRLPKAVDNLMELLEKWVQNSY
jgi:hypothetical protein